MKKMRVTKIHKTRRFHFRGDLQSEDVIFMITDAPAE
jgi:hypothetical protein